MSREEQQCERCKRLRTDIREYEVVATVPFRIKFCDPCAKKVAKTGKQVSRVTEERVPLGEKSAPANGKRFARPTRASGRAERGQAPEGEGGASPGPTGVESATEGKPARGPGGKFLKKGERG